MKQMPGKTEQVQVKRTTSLYFGITGSCILIISHSNRTIIESTTNWSRNVGINSLQSTLFPCQGYLIYISRCLLSSSYAMNSYSRLFLDLFIVSYIDLNIILLYLFFPDQSFECFFDCILE